MSETEKVRAQISATVAEIEANPMRTIATDPADSEAYEIVRRIERKLLRQPGTYFRRQSEDAGT